MEAAGGREHARDTRKVLVEAAGLLGAAVSLVYLTGGLVLALRFQEVDLPSTAVVGQLPRELLISTGLAYVIIPALVAGGTYFGWRLARGERSQVPGLGSWGPMSPSTTAWSVLTWCGIGLVLALPAPAWALLRGRTNEFHFGDLEYYFASVLVLAATALLFRIGLVSLIARYESRWQQWQAIAAVSGAVALLAVPALATFAGKLSLLTAKTCLADGSSLSGRLIGETATRVYLGENRDPPRVASLPSDRVHRLFVGPDAAGAGCGPPPSRAKSS